MLTLALAYLFPLQCVYSMGVPIQAVLSCSVACAYMGIMQPSTTSIKNHTHTHTHSHSAQSKEACKAFRTFYGKHTVLQERQGANTTCPNTTRTHTHTQNGPERCPRCDREVQIR